MSDSVKMNEMEKLLEEVRKNEWSRGMITKFFIQVLHEGKDENLELLLFSTWVRTPQSTTIIHFGLHLLAVIKRPIMH